jgi:hypothetical protein
MKMTKRESEFMSICEAFWAADPLALDILHGKVADGSYEAARGRYRSIRGREAMQDFDIAAQRLYRQVGDAHGLYLDDSAA